MDAPPVFRHIWSSWGACTRAVLLTLVAVHLLLLLPLPLPRGFRWCFVPDLRAAVGSAGGVRPGAIVAFFAAPAVHAGLLHLLLNCAAWTALAPVLEAGLGTAPFLLLVLAAAAASQALLAAVGTVAAVLGAGSAGGGSLGCVLGFSGVLFALLAVECYAERPHQAFSLLCGVVSVPARAYPWLLLAAIALLAPGTSTACHLCGLLCGLAASYLPCSLWTGGLGLRALGYCLPPCVTAAESWLPTVGGPGRAWGAGTSSLFHAEGAPFSQAPFSHGDGGPPTSAAPDGFPALPVVTSVGPLAIGPQFQAFGGPGRRLGGAGAEAV